MIGLVNHSKHRLIRCVVQDEFTHHSKRLQKMLASFRAVNGQADRDGGTSQALDKAVRIMEDGVPPMEPVAHGPLYGC